jgi:hypothetical protein
MPIRKGHMTFHLKSLGKFRKDDPTQEGFLDDLMLLVVKCLLFIRIVEFVWLQRVSYKLCPQIVLQFRKVFVETILLNFVQKTMSLYV